MATVTYRSNRDGVEASTLRVAAGARPRVTAQEGMAASAAPFLLGQTRGGECLSSRIAKRDPQPSRAPAIPRLFAPLQSPTLDTPAARCGANALHLFASPDAIIEGGEKLWPDLIFRLP